MKGTEQGRFNYFRIGRLGGRAGSISHVVFESHKNGGRIIFADGFEHVMRETVMTKEELIEFYKWLVKQIETRQEPR